MLRELEADPALGPRLLLGAGDDPRGVLPRPGRGGRRRGADGLQLAAPDDRHAAAAVRSAPGWTACAPCLPDTDPHDAGRGRAGRRWRRGGRGARLAAVAARRRRPRPRAGRLGPDDDIPKRHADWQVRARRYWSPSAERRGWPADYPVRNLRRQPRRRLRLLGGRRQRDGLGRRVLALPPVGLPRRDARRLRPRLAHRLRRPRALLRDQRGRDGHVRHCAGDPTAPPTSERAAAARLHRRDGRALDRRLRAARLVLVGRSTRRSPRATTAAGRRARTTGTARSAARPARSRRPRTRTGPRRCATACGCRRARGCARSRVDTRGRADRRALPRARRSSCSARPRASSCSPATGWARRGCCSCRRRLRSPTGWRTRAAWSAATSWSTCRRRSSGASRSARAPTTGPGARRRRRGTSTRPTPTATSSAGSSSPRCAASTPLDTALQTAGWGEGHHAAVEHHLNHEAVCWVCGDDEPEPHNRVELDHERPRRVRAAWRRDALHAVGELAAHRRGGRSRRATELVPRRGRGLRAAASGFDTHPRLAPARHRADGRRPGRLRRRRLAPLPRRARTSSSSTGR